MATNNNSELLASIEINPSAPAEAVIIWLHGLGATNDDFVPVASDLQLQSGHPLRFVFPQAPLLPVTINNGAVMPAWFDIVSFDRDGKIDEKGIQHSIHQLLALVAREKENGFSSKQIFLAGFSQGAVIALSTLLAYPEALGGVIALSGYLPVAKVPPAKQRTPIFMGHGIEDDIVPYLLGQTAYEALEKAEYVVTACAYGMGHSVCGEEVQDLADWLSETLA